jgi:hypothetical protein
MAESVFVNKSGLGFPQAAATQLKRASLLNFYKWDVLFRPNGRLHLVAAPDTIVLPVPA